MLPVLDRYLLREITLNWLAITLVLWVIVVTNRLVRYLGEAAAGDIPASVIFTLLGLKSVTYLPTLLPLSLFLGVMLAFGRLYKDSEMVAMVACGVGPARIYRPLLWMAGLVSLLLLALSLGVSPYAAELGYRLRAEAEQRAQVSAVAAGRFQEAADGKVIFYAERISGDGRRLEGVFARSDRRPRALISARSAHTRVDPETGDRFLVMEDGYRYQGFPGEEDFRIIHFARHGMRIETGEARPELKRDAIPTAELLGSRRGVNRAELQWRVSLAVAAFVLVVLAVPLSRTSPRQGRYGRLFVAILVFIVYYNLLGTARVWLERNMLPAFPGLWWVHLLPLGLAWWLWRRLRPARPKTA
ncbi:MAG TPA: LPS export ABC transporter permease LptF [Thiotrichales bacterium]|nr:LPS export ABC transporter permease LptF [Thiotrichales bacterium]